MTKSDYAHEYAAAEFLKWFTDTKQNVKFAITTGYFPVKNEALSEELTSMPSFEKWYEDLVNNANKILKG